MAKFTFEGPGGQRKTIEGPDGATKEQAFQELNRLLSEESAQRKATGEADMKRMADPQAGMGALEKFTVGAGAATDRAIRGIGGLLTNVVGPEGNTLRQTLDKKNDDAEAYKKHHPGGWATAGEIAGDIAMSAIPVAKGGQVLSKAVGATGRFAPAIGDIAANTLYSAATAPEGERGVAAAAGGVGATAGRVLNRAVSGVVRPSKVGQELMDQGVRLTPGQAGEGVMGRGAKAYERFLEATPGAATAMDWAKTRAVKDWNKTIGVGAEAVEHGFPKGNIKLDRAAYDGLKEFGTHLADGVAPNVRQKFLTTTGKIHGALAEGLDSGHYKEAVLDELAKGMDLAKRNGQESLYQAYKEFGENLGNVLERSTGKPGVAENLGKMATQAQEGRVLRQAAALPGEAVYPEQLMRHTSGTPEMAQKIAKGHEVFGDSPSETQKVINRVAKVASPIIHGTLGKLTIPGITASLAGVTQPGAKYLLGQYGWQKQLAKHPAKLAAALRALSTKAAEGEENAP